MKNLTLNHLVERGVFRNPNDNQYYNNLLPTIFSNAEEIAGNDFCILNKLNDTYHDNFIDHKKNLHRAALIKERERKEMLEIQKKQEIERRKAERRAKREEEVRIKKEQQMIQLKNSVNDELIKQVEFVDDANDIYEINGYHQKGKKYAGVLGGYFGQFAIIIAYFNKIIPDYLNEEKLIKVLELFIPKAPPINIIYKAEEVDQYKVLDANIQAIEDVNKSPDNIYVR
jgi:hypothetical protein